MKIISAILIAAAFLTACAGSPTGNLEQVAASYIGYGADRLVAELGDAQSIRQVGARTVVMTYLLAESMESGDLRDPLTSSAARVSINAVTTTCATSFTLEEGVVVSYAIDWDQCASLTGPR